MKKVLLGLGFLLFLISCATVKVEDDSGYMAYKAQVLSEMEEFQNNNWEGAGDRLDFLFYARKAGDFGSAYSSPSDLFGEYSLFFNDMLTALESYMVNYREHWATYRVEQREKYREAQQEKQREAQEKASEELSYEDRETWQTDLDIERTILGTTAVYPNSSNSEVIPVLMAAMQYSRLLVYGVQKDWFYRDVAIIELMQMRDRLYDRQMVFANNHSSPYAIENATKTMFTILYIDSDLEILKTKPVE